MGDYLPDWIQQKTNGKLSIMSPVEHLPCAKIVIKTHMHYIHGYLTLSFWILCQTVINSEDPNSGISSMSALFIKIFTNLQLTNKLYEGNRNNLFRMHANSLDQDQTALNWIHNLLQRS